MCPHDCPSQCALEVELLDERTIGRVRGASANSYTAGIICEKVARYAERIHHPDRLIQPLKRRGPKGSGDFVPISWDDALDETAEAMLAAEKRYGPAAVWPYYYAGTMGLVMRDGINRLRHAKRYSGMYDTICVALAWPGVTAGTGRVAGTDPREMAKSDLIVIWGTNPAHTQINVMSHAVKARRERGAKIAVIDIYETATMKQADIGVIVKPGTDGALAAAIMHVLFRDGLADWNYMEKYTDDPKGLARHLADRSPQWAEAICGVPTAEIELLARLIGTTSRTFFRVGYGFSRSRNGAVNIHAAADDAHPFRLATSPARGFLNSTFNETPTSRRREGRPTVMMHPADMAVLGLVAGDKVKLGNHRGVVTLHVEANGSLRRGVLIAESIWPNDAFEDGAGINTLVGADQPAPAGGGAFHDVKVWVRRA